MFRQPNVSDFKDYEQYALAVFGFYAVCCASGAGLGCSAAGVGVGDVDGGAVVDFCREGVAGNARRFGSGCCGTSFRGVVDEVASVVGPPDGGCGPCGDDGVGPSVVGSGKATSVGVKKPKHAGDNWQRNRDARAKKKANAKARRQASVEVERESSGFWKSCSEEVRQQLIDSKARMHIAENNRKAREEEKRVRKMDSPEGHVSDVLKLLKLANEIRKVDNDNKVAGWATVVANECAETVARSVPSTAKSYEDFVASQGGVSSRSSAPEEVVIKEVIREIPVEVVKYVDRVVEKVVEKGASSVKGVSKDYFFSTRPANDIETWVLKNGICTTEDIVVARARVRRVLSLNDFQREDSPFKLSASELLKLQMYVTELKEYRKVRHPYDGFH